MIITIINGIAVCKNSLFRYPHSCMPFICLLLQCVWCLSLISLSLMSHVGDHGFGNLFWLGSPVFSNSLFSIVLTLWKNWTSPLWHKSVWNYYNKFIKFEDMYVTCSSTDAMKMHCMSLVTVYFSTFSLYFWSCYTRYWRNVSHVGTSMFTYQVTNCIIMTPFY